jgi:hypothetical protein
VPSFTTAIAIRFDQPPAPGAAFGSVAGQVQDPALLQKFGFPKLSPGETVRLSQEDPLQIAGRTRPWSGWKARAFTSFLSLTSRGRCSL